MRLMGLVWSDAPRPRVTAAVKEIRDRQEPGGGWSQFARTEPDAWTHRDLMPGNLLAENGRLAGVIDVGMFTVSDPAMDLQPAWNLFDPTARAAFRTALGSDEDEWRRGMGWSFAQAIGCLWYYVDTNPVMSRTAHHTLTALLDAA